MVEFRKLRSMGESDFVAVTEAGEIAAHAAVVLDPATDAGELEGVGTRHAHVRRGLARAIALASLRHMRESGVRHAVVRTEAENGPAIRLYKSVGFRVADRLHRYVRP
ncbi:GNAT family N-acetyltransferase [Candidatus Poribacteria bacterium]|jgi:ribosomal protein S18 acetylase RimI-like enzyme|nr:GNAT family N-acetyltransferase [Candidatus Poribacteria bacterium]MBT5531440.1 GNAT family N-acetyltransferase [Candidatus Poribacteria bacterium]MBT5712158.1 GNAT family N-acetyltransferase [Candidatus Poribacteria bacterium]MBT7099497.1 GNAT family N-acetyltransferase [Candidatus Poribacteria bacterium]MBT7804791.1 GNAT family N-acetyltransferase [Candidatus Poribacteria bacterium]